MRRAMFWFGTLTAALVAVLTGCQPTRPPQGEFHLVVLGSSTAAGIGPADPSQAWPARYQRYLRTQGVDVRLSNLARSPWA